MAGFLVWILFHILAHIGLSYYFLNLADVLVGFIIIQSNIGQRIDTLFFIVFLTQVIIGWFLYHNEADDSESQEGQEHKEKENIVPLIYPVIHEEKCNKPQRIRAIHIQTTFLPHLLLTDIARYNVADDD